MTHPIRTRNALNDWLHSRDRMQPHDPHEPARMTVIDLLQGCVCIGLVLILLWLTWQVSTPAGVAEIENFARYIFINLKEIF